MWCQPTGLLVYVLHPLQLSVPALQTSPHFPVSKSLSPLHSLCPHFPLKDFSSVPWMNWGRTLHRQGSHPKYIVCLSFTPYGQDVSQGCIRPRGQLRLEILAVLTRTLRAPACVTPRPSARPSPGCFTTSCLQLCSTMFLLTEEKVISTFMIPLLVLTCPQLLREGENYKKKKKSLYCLYQQTKRGLPSSYLTYRVPYSARIHIYLF